MCLIEPANNGKVDVVGVHVSFRPPCPSTQSSSRACILFEPCYNHLFGYATSSIYECDAQRCYFHVAVRLIIKEEHFRGWDTYVCVVARTNINAMHWINGNVSIHLSIRIPRYSQLVGVPELVSTTPFRCHAHQHSLSYLSIHRQSLLFIARKKTRTTTFRELFKMFQFGTWIYLCILS